MALVTLANPLVDISGSVGGSVFSRDSSGLHLVSCKRHLRRRSPLQDRRRRAFLTADQAWRQVYELGHTEVWNLDAKRHPTKNRVGDTTTLSGYQWFMHFNIYRAYNKVACILLPPEG